MALPACAADVPSPPFGCMCDTLLHAESPGNPRYRGDRSRHPSHLHKASRQAGGARRSEPEGHKDARRRTALRICGDGSGRCGQPLEATCLTCLQTGGHLQTFSPVLPQHTCLTAQPLRPPCRQCNFIKPQTPLFITSDPETRSMLSRRAAHGTAAPPPYHWLAMFWSEGRGVAKRVPVLDFVAHLNLKLSRLQSGA